MREDVTWYTVTLSSRDRWGETYEYIHSAHLWCAENVGPRNEHWYYKGACRFEFNDPAKAAEFALIWV
jgi:hypothetical protein